MALKTSFFNFICSPLAIHIILLSQLILAIPQPDDRNQFLNKTSLNFNKFELKKNSSESYIYKVNSYNNSKLIQSLGCSQNCSIDQSNLEKKLIEIQEKICRIKNCNLNQEDLRQQQCSIFNQKSFEGKYYFWLKAFNNKDPCSLYCDAYLKNSVGNLEPVFNKSLKLQKWVVDGTGCSEDLNSYCINNKCTIIDCESVFGEKLKLDSCGVCGGNNSSCQNKIKSYNYEEHVWDYSDFNECIPDCSQNEIISDETEDNFSPTSIGFQTSFPICLKVIKDENNVEISRENTEIENCDFNKKPNVKIRACDDFIYHCKPKWFFNKWSNCSENCGFGVKVREIYCGLVSRSTFLDGQPKQILKVDSSQCNQNKAPLKVEKCQSFECSEWLTGPWSECSVICGDGIQKRDVKCQNKFGDLKQTCKLDLKPQEQQKCFRKCSFLNDLELKDEAIDSKNLSDVYLNVQITEEPSWITGQWSSCSQSCGQGIKTRDVECKMLFKFSGTIATLTDDQCHENKPEQSQSCFERPCDEENEIEEKKIFNKNNFKEIFVDSNKKTINYEKEMGSILAASSNTHLTRVLDVPDNKILKPYENIESETVFKTNFESDFQWIISGFTECTKPCLGGTQDSIIKCVNKFNNSEVLPSNCDFGNKPDYLTRTCNDQPCPPRWNISEYGPCSKTCGKGVQFRKINCIHEVTVGEENVIQLPNSNCTHPPPFTQKFCAIRDCESRWVVGEWSDCKQRCGKKGKQTRTVKCFRLLAYGEDVELPKVHCKNLKRPKFKKRCLSKTCIPPKVKNDLKDFKNISKKVIKPNNENNKFSIDNTINFKRTHIDVKKLEDEQRKWKKMKKYNSEIEKSIEKNENIPITENNNIDIYSVNTNPVKNKFKNYKDKNKLSFHSNEYSNLNKKTINSFSTSSGISHQSVVIQLRNLQQLLTKLLTRKSKNKEFDNQDQNLNAKKENDSESIKNFSFKEKKESYEENEIEDIDENEDKRLAYNIVNKLSINEDSIKSLMFDWILSDWSPCSVSCGNGFQVRGIHCMAKLGNITKAVNEIMCLNAGLEKPFTIKKCGTSNLEFNCITQWKVQQWTPCNICIGKNTGIQTRVVQCVRQLSEEPVSSKLCSDLIKPEHRRNCHNPKCFDNDIIDQIPTLNPINIEDEDEERSEEILKL